MFEVILELVEVGVPSVTAVPEVARDELDAVVSELPMLGVVDMDVDPDMLPVIVILEPLFGGLMLEELAINPLVELWPDTLLRLELPFCDVTTLLCELPWTVLLPELPAVIVELGMPL